jgi:hypothetical protein
MPDTHVVIALDVRDPGSVSDGISTTGWHRSYFESHDAAFLAYQAARSAGLEVRAEKVRTRHPVGASA